MKINSGIYRKCLAGVLSAIISLSMVSVPVQAADTWPFTGESAPGINQPSVYGYTSGQIANWSPETDPDAQLLRSRVPLQKRIDAFAATQANPNLKSNVKMFNLAGDYGNAFIDNAPYTNKFAQYHFNFWQYTDYFSPWHGTATAYTPREYYDETAQKDWKAKWFEFGCMNVPNPTYTDAAHKNGVLSLGGIFLSDNDRGQQTYKQMLVKDSNGKYIVAEKMVDIAKYYGFDGYFFNQEESDPKNVETSDIPDYIAFLKVFQKAGLYVQWYDAVDTSSGATSYTRYLTDNNISWLYDKTEKEPVTNSFFFDYGVGSSQINSTNTYLNNLNSTYGTTYNIFDIGFAGLEAGRDRWRNSLDSKLSGGLPATSIATLGSDFVHSGLDDDMGLQYPDNHRNENEYQWMTAVRERLWWSGPNQDPRNTTPAAINVAGDVYADNTTWKGIASAISERSVIGGSNFYTNFNTGHGLSYFVNGQKSNEDEWSNMSLQDIPVTWQWWQDTTTESAITVDFDYGPEYAMTGDKNNRFAYEKIGGYNGGNSLVINGKLAAEDFLRLYKTELNVKASSKLSITFNKPVDNDASSMSVGLIFKDDPANVVKVPVANTGNKTSGWSTAELDLSAYAGKTIAVLGLVFDNGGSVINNYQMNIGQIRLYDGSAVKPAAPTGLKITNAFTDTNEMYIKWDMDTDYSKVKQYNIYVNDTYVGGKYDSIFYIKKLPARSGTLKVTAVGADGTEGDAATVSFNLDKAVSGIKVDSKADGTFNVSWQNPADSSATGDVTVKVRSVNLPSDKIISKEITVPAGSTSASLNGMPINGDDYILDIAVGSNNAVSKSGNFIDKVCEPYAEKFSVNGTNISLPMPNTRDWRYMYVYEDGVAKKFATTYGSGEKPMIVRGRSTKGCLNFSSSATIVSVQMEDYAGNKSDSVAVKNPVVTDATFPDPVLLKWVTDNVGPYLIDVLNYKGSIDLSGLEITDLSGLTLFKNVENIKLSNTKIVQLGENMLPSGVSSLDISDCKDLLYITEGLFKGLNNLKTLNITGDSKLKLLSLKGSTVSNLIYGDKTAFTALISVDFSDTALNLKTGTPARIFADYIKAHMVAGQNVTLYKAGVISTIKDGSPVITGTFMPIGALFDGDLSNYGYCSNSGGIATLDFKKDFVMRGIKIYGGYDAVENFNIYYSVDGVNFTQIGDSVSDNQDVNYEAYFDKPVTARYFKFEVPSGNGYVYLNELQVMGDVQVIYPGGVIFKGSDKLTVSSFTPDNAMNDVGIYAPLRMIFADKVASGTGDITIYNIDDSVFQTIKASSEKVSISGDTVTIKHDKFELGKTYYVKIDPNAFTDLSGVQYAGISGKTDWSFTTSFLPDTAAPSELSGTSVSAGNGKLTITWTDPADVDFDHVVVAGPAIAAQNIAKGTQKAVISGLENGKNYNITLKTVDMSGNESGGTSVSGIPTAEPDTREPGEVGKISIWAGNGQLVIRWTDPSDADFDHVIVTGPAITLQNVAKGTQVAVISGLENGRTYDISLKTIDFNGNESTGISLSGTPISSSSSSASSSTSSTTSVVPEKVKVDGNSIIIVEKPQLDSSNGIAKTVQLTEENINKALKNAEKDSDGVRTLKLEIPKVNGAKGYSAQLPTSLLTVQDNATSLNIVTDIGSVQVPSDMLSAMQVKNANSVEIVAGLADAGKISGSYKEQIGNRPVIELNVKVDGKTVSWQNPDAPVVVRIPYKPAAEELKNSEHIVVWYIDGEGKIIPVPNARYDASSGMVTFTTTHFSKYAVAFVQKIYSDIPGEFWGRNAVEVLASKGIVEGTSDNTFSPDKKATRGEFMMWLVKTLGLTADIDGNFSDVDITDVYYREVGIAKKLGITSGVGDNKFNPEAAISRQDMMVLTAKAMAIAGIKLEAGSQSDLSRFTYLSQISKYAVENVAAMVKTQLVVGSNDKINPRANITRAEVTQILYKIYNKF